MPTDQPVIDTHSGIGDSIQAESNQGETTIKLSKRRWLILFAMALFGFTTSLCAELSPILNTVLKLLELDVNQYVYINQVPYYLLVILSMPSAWFVDRYGIRPSMYISVILMLIRGVLRGLLFYPNSPHWESLKLFYFISSSVIGVIEFTCFICLPLKVSELWFSESERSVAWTIMISSSSLATSIAAFTFPRFLNDDLSNIELLSYMNIISAAITVPIVFLCITRSTPKHPPSLRMINSTRGLEHAPYFQTVKQMIRHKNIMLHMLHGSIYEGVIISVSSLVQDLFHYVDKSKVFVGDLIATNNLLSMFLSIGLSTLVHRAENTTLVCKLASAAQVLTVITYISTMKFYFPNWLVLIVSFTFTSSRCWLLPNANNMTAHLTSGIVSQATVVGFAMVIGVVITSAIQTAFVSISTKTDQDKTDYTYSLIFVTVVCLVNTLSYVIFFNGRRQKRPRPTSSEESIN